jgi:hypothetical protein
MAGEWDIASVGTASAQGTDGVTTPGAIDPAAADPWAVKTVGQSGNNGNAGSSAASPWEIKTINGQPAGSSTGFWADFGKGTGGVTGVLTAPFTESIPAELGKEHARAPWYMRTSETFPAYVATDLLVRWEQFMHQPDEKPFRERMHESFGALINQAKTHPGAATGSLIKGLAADPELFFLPGATEAQGAITLAKIAKAAGAGAKTANVAGAVGSVGTRAATAGAIGGGAEVSRELGEDLPLDPGAIGVSGVIGSLAGGVLQVHPKAARMTPEEIDRFLVPTIAGSGGEPHPHAEVVPTADGYQVKPAGSAEGKTFATKAEAEAAAKEIADTASAYRVMDTVPRGTTERNRLLAENPFTPEKMADMVRRPAGDARMTGKELATFWTKAAVSAGIGAGIGAWLDRDEPGTGAAFGAAITLVPRALPKDKRVSIEDAINTRNGALAVMARPTLQFKSAIDAEVPEPLRRAAISLALEKTPGVTLNPAEQRVAESVRQFFDSMGNTAVDAGVLKELLKDYVSHIVDEDPEAKAKGTIDKIVEALTNKPRATEATSGKQFAQHRQYATFGELQAALRGSGLRIKTGDIGEIMAIYSKAMFRTITDKRLLTALKSTPVEGMPPRLMPAEPQHAGSPSTAPRLERQAIEGTATPTQEKLPGPGGDGNLPATTHAQPPGASPLVGAPDGSGGSPPPGATGPSGFQAPPEPPPGVSAQKFANRPPRMLVQPQEHADGNYVTLPNRQLSGFAVHKDIAPQLNFIFSAKDPNDVTLGLMALNQASKRAIVSFSLFHAKSLTDAFIGAMGTKAFSGKSRVEAALKMFRNGGDNGGIDSLLKNGLQVQLPEDVSTDQLQGALSRIAAVVDKALPLSAATKGVGAIAKMNEKLDHFTFTTLQTGFKLVTALDALERLNKKGITGDRAAKMAASYSNDIYGGLDWFRVANDVASRIGRDIAYGFFNPNGRRWSQILMFAPDWTFSTFRAAYKALPGAVDDPALAALHRRYLAKSALYYLTIANGINLITAGHSIFSNENPTRVQLADGRTMQWSKHSMEPFEWLKDPIQTSDNKLAFLPRTLIELGTGKEYVSAHDTAPDLESRGKLIAESFLPINAQQGMAGGGAESLLGLIGMPIYGKTAEQKTAAKLEKKKQQEEKKRRAAEHFSRLHQ